MQLILKISKLNLCCLDEKRTRQKRKAYLWYTEKKKTKDLNCLIFQGCPLTWENLKWFTAHCLTYFRKSSDFGLAKFYHCAFKCIYYFFIENWKILVLLKFGYVSFFPFAGARGVLLVFILAQHFRVWILYLSLTLHLYSTL